LIFYASTALTSDTVRLKAESEELCSVD